MINNYFDKYGHICYLHLDDPFYKYKVNKNRLQLWFMKHSTISPKYISIRSQPRSFAKLRNEILDQLQNYPYTLHPFSAITFYCNAIWMIVVFMWLMMVPCDIFKNLDVDRYWQGKPEYLEMFLATVTLVDVFRRFFTGFVVHHCDSVEIVLDLRRISRKYLKTYFLIDLIPSLPSFIELNFLESPNYYLTVEIFTHLRIFRAITMLKAFKNCLYYFKFSSNMVDTVSGIIILWIVVHWVSCFSIAAGVIEQHFDPYRLQWYSDILTPDLTFVQKYLICLHRTVSILTGTGFKFIRNTEHDFIYTIFTAILGHIITVILFARVYCMVVGMTSVSAKYDSMIDEATAYMKYKPFKKSTEKKIHMFYAYKYEYSFFKEHAILESIPLSLQQSVLLDNAKLLLRNIQYFHKLPNSLVAKIVSHLARELFLPDDIIYKVGDATDKMYFLLHGTVAEFSVSGREILHIEDGSQFGEGMLTSDNTKSLCSMISIETSEIFRLTREDAVALIDFCPDLLELMEQETSDRKNNTDTIDERYQQLAKKSLMPDD